MTGKNKKADKPAFRKYISTLLNCEWQIYRLNSHTDLNRNPYLEYWVKTYHDLQKSVTGASLSSRTSILEDDDTPTETRIQELKSRCMLARLEILHYILTEFREPEKIRLVGGERSPWGLFEMASVSKVVQFNLRQFQPIFEATGNYSLHGTVFDRQNPLLSSVPITSPGKDEESSERLMVNDMAHENGEDTEHVLVDNDKRKGKAATAIPLITPKTTAAEVEAALQIDQQAVIHALTRLPIDLTSLELLTNLLISPTFHNLELDSVSLTCEYIQHSLRTIERMASGIAGDMVGFSDASMSEQSLDSIPPGGREETSRAVRLLVLFLRNLLRRGTIAYQDLYFDIEEICVRYIWIKEVREFRTFLEALEKPVEPAFSGASGG
jgi:hypothetical protein